MPIFYNSTKIPLPTAPIQEPLIARYRFQLYRLITQIKNSTERFNQKDIHSAILLCEKIEALGYNWQNEVRKCLTSSELKSTEEKNKKHHTQLGSSNPKFIVLLCFFTLLISFIFASKAYTNSSISPQNSLEKLIPPPFILPGGGEWLPSVNQFILIPKIGKLHVVYSGLFINSYKAKGTKILLPLPDRIENLQIEFLEDSKLVFSSHDKNNTNQKIILDTSLLSGINQVTAEFDLPATWGSAQWSSRLLKNLPGVVLFVMEDFSTSQLLSKDSLPSLLPIPEGFRSQTKSSFQERHEYSEKHDNLTPKKQKEFLRVNFAKDAPYPAFIVEGLYPSFVYAYILAGLFGFILLCGLLFSRKFW